VVATGHGTAGIDHALVRAPATSGDVPALVSVGDRLDAARARRLNRFARMATDAVGQALTDAGYEVRDPARIGASIGTSWGSLDDSAAFIRRVTERGARLAPPADFPNLVVSAAVGHLSIYHGFKGPTLTAAALTVSGEMALLMAADEIVAGRADAMAAGAAEERNPLVLGLIDRLRVAHSSDSARAPRSEGSACVLLEAEETARARGARPIARIAAWHQATYAPEPGVIEDGGDAIAGAVTRAVKAVVASMPPTAGIDAVVTPISSVPIRDGLTAALANFPPLYELGPRAGFYEAMGTLAIAGAARLLARGEAERGALVLGAAPGAVYAILLTRP
jgi:3-oxoacyl-[acyl-carrier-protein] synthase II